MPRREGLFIGYDILTWVHALSQRVAGTTLFDPAVAGHVRDEHMGDQT